MTARQVFEGMLTELNKVNAPSLLLQDFNYFFNKAINLYINKRYNIYDVNLQTSDDLRVLKATATLDAVKPESGLIAEINNLTAGKSQLMGATYETLLPDDYLHILNCICVYRLTKNFKCYNSGDHVAFAAKRLTADSFSVILNDYYLRPLPERPYFYIHNVNNNLTGDKSLTPTNSETDITNKFSDTNSNFSKTINLGDLWKGSPKTANTVEKEAAQRYGNPSKVRMEIRYGHDDSIFKLEKVLIDYIKTPQHIRLTQELMNLTEDTSQIMEFPDYVCQEIINELTMIVMENASDPRTLTNPIVSLSIANPAPQLAQPNLKKANK